MPHLRCRPTPADTSKSARPDAGRILRLPLRPLGAKPRGRIVRRRGRHFEKEFLTRSQALLQRQAGRALHSRTVTIADFVKEVNRVSTNWVHEQDSRLSKFHRWDYVQHTQGSGWNRIIACEAQRRVSDSLVSREHKRRSRRQNHVAAASTCTTAASFDERIPHTVESLTTKVFLICRGEFCHPVMPKGVGEAQIDDPTGGEPLPGRLLPHIIHHGGRLNQ